MTQLDLLETTNELASLNFEVFALFLTISSFAFAGAYVAGRKLDWILSLGIAGLYSIAALGLLLSRHTQIQKFEILDDALRTLIEEEGSNATLRDYLETSTVSSFDYLVYAAIWISVVFFIFYARARFGADD